MKIKKIILPIFEIAVTLILLILIVKKLDYNRLKELYSTLSYKYLIGVAILWFCAVCVSSLRWWTLLKAQEIEISFWNVLRYYLIGLFFSMILLGTVSGDLVRSYSLGKYTRRKIAAFSSTAVDRLLGFSGMLSWGLFCLPFTWWHLNLANKVEITLMILSILACLLLGLYILLHQELINKIKKLFPFLENLKLLELAEKFHNSLLYFSKHKVILWKVFALVLVSHFIIFLNTYFLIRSVNISIPFLYITSIVPICNTLIALPISIQGIGPREILYHHFLKQYGVSITDVVSYILIGYVYRLGWALVGAILFMIETRRNRE